MSASQWDWSPASADGLLTNEECFMLLDVDVFDDDLFKTFPAAPKVEPVKYQPHDELSSTLYPPSPPETKPNRADLATDLLQQIENQCKQENIFPNWLEEKVDLPMFEDMSQVRSEQLMAPYTAAVAPQATEELLREFETVYGAVELTHLTPPQSPPGPATQLLLSYAQQAQCAVPVPVPVVPVVPVPAAGLLWEPEPLSVDQLVRERAAELVSPAPSVSSVSAPSSPRSPRSPHSPHSLHSPHSTDEEWSSPRAKPYSRHPEDRRSRKKEQNKNAATRYRQKKKAEVEVLLNEEQALRRRHNDLGDKCSDLQREIRYLKGLMRDLFKAKGLIK